MCVKFVVVKGGFFFRYFLIFLDCLELEVLYWILGCGFVNIEEKFCGFVLLLKLILCRKCIYFF